MADAPRDRRILIAFEGDEKTYCGQWVDKPLTGKAGPFWCSDRVHAVGLREERASTPRGWLPLPEGVESPAPRPDRRGDAVLVDGAHYWVRVGDDPTPTVARRASGSWRLPGRDGGTIYGIAVLEGPVRGPGIEGAA